MYFPTRSASSDRRSYLLTSVDAQNRDINTVQYKRFEPVTSTVRKRIRLKRKLPGDKTWGRAENILCS